MTRVVVCGLAGQMPLAGMGLHYLQYCLGLRDLGVEVVYLEDHWGYAYDPDLGTAHADGGYACRWLGELFGAFDVPWAFMDGNGDYHGLTGDQARAACDGADLLLNVSGGHLVGDHHRRARTLALVDTDPAFLQVKAALGDRNVRDQYDRHDVLFTFAESLGTPSCRIPDAGYTWKPTRQPVHLDFWATEHPVGDVYTTVMHWDAYGETQEWDGEVWGQKKREFPLVRALPARTGLPLEIAVAGLAPRDELRAEGWRVIDPLPVSRTVWDLRDYIRASRGELTVHKQAFVRSRSGWFAERSANYLASGRPVVAQDTGWSAHLPSGEGLLGFSTTDEAASALRRVETTPERHAAAARRVAAEHFDARLVLGRLLSDAATG